MSIRQQGSMFLNTRELLVSVGETTMMSKHQIPFDRHLQGSPRRNRNQSCRSSIQFKMPNVAGMSLDRPSILYRMKNSELGHQQLQNQEALRGKKQSASVMRMVGEFSVVDQEHLKKDKRYKSVLSKRIMEAREEVLCTQSIAQIHKQYLFALSLVKNGKKESSHREGMVLLTDIQSNLLKMYEQSQSADYLELLYQVNQQLGLQYKKKTLWLAAVEFLQKAIHFCKLLQKEGKGNLDLDLKICEITIQKAQCQFSLKQMQQTQKDVQMVTNKAQKIIDEFGEEDADNEHFKRAILLHAQASKLCAEMLESNKQFKQAHDIFVRASELIAGVFMNDPSPAYTKLMNQLQNATQRTKVTMQFMKSGMTPTPELISYDSQIKRDADYTSYQTQPYFRKGSQIYSESRNGKESANISMSSNFDRVIKKAPPQEFKQNKFLGPALTQQSTEFDNLQQINPNQKRIQSDLSFQESQQKTMQSTIKFRPYQFPVQMMQNKSYNHATQSSQLSSKCNQQLLSNATSPLPTGSGHQSRNSNKYMDNSSFALSPNLRSPKPKNNRKYRYDSFGPDTGRETTPLVTEPDLNQSIRFDKNKKSIFLIENTNGEVQLSSRENKKQSIVSSNDRNPSFERKAQSKKSSLFTSKIGTTTPYISSKMQIQEEPTTVTTTMKNKKSYQGMKFKYPRNVNGMYRVNPHIQASKMAGVLSDFYYDGQNKQYQRSPNNIMNQSVSYNCKTLAETQNNIDSHGIMSDNQSANNSWMNVSASFKDRVIAKKNFQRYNQKPFQHMRTRSECFDGNKIMKQRTFTRKKVKSKSKSRSKKVSKSRSKSKSRSPQTRNQDSKLTLNDMRQPRLVVDTVESEQKLQLLLNQPSAEEIVCNQIDDTQNETQIINIQVDDYKQPQKPEPEIKMETGENKNTQSPNQDLNVEDESLHPNQNLQSEGPDYDAMRSTTAINNLAQQVEDMKNEQKEQKDMLNLMLKKQDQLLNQQIAIKSIQQISPVNNQTSKARFPRPETANFGKDDDEKQGQSRSVNQQMPKSLTSQIKTRQKSNNITKNKLQQVGSRQISIATPILPKNLKSPKQPSPSISKMSLAGVDTQKSRNRSKKKQKSPRIISSDQAINSKRQGKHGRYVHDLPQKRILTPSDSESSFKMSYKDGRFLLMKLQRLNQSRRSLEDLSIYADFFEDHQLTISLRVYSRKDKKELKEGHRDLVFILYGEIAMTSNDFRGMAAMYLKQVSWKTTRLDEYIDCIKMMVRAAIEKHNQRVKIEESIIEPKRIVYKVIQKVNFENEESSSRKREQDVSVIKTKVIEQPVERDESQIVLHNNDLQIEQPVNVIDQVQDESIKIQDQMEQEPEKQDNPPAQIEEDKTIAIQQNVIANLLDDQASRGIINIEAKQMFEMTNQTFSYNNLMDASEQKQEKDENQKQEAGQDSLYEPNQDGLNADSKKEIEIAENELEGILDKNVDFEIGDQESKQFLRSTEMRNGVTSSQTQRVDGKMKEEILNSQKAISDVHGRSQGFQKSVSHEDSTLKSFVDDGESQKQIIVNDKSKEVIIDLQSFLRDNVSQSQSNLQKSQFIADLNAAIPRNDSELKVEKIEKLLAVAERLLSAEEYRHGLSDSNRSVEKEKNLSYQELIQGQINKNGTIHLIVLETLSQQQYKIKLKCEKDHLKIQIVNLNCLQEELIRSKFFEDGQQSIEVLDVQVFQKLDYDKALFDLVKRVQQTDNIEYTANFFKNCLQIASRADGEIQDVNIQENAYYQDNLFLECQYFIEPIDLEQNRKFVEKFMIFCSIMDICETKYRKKKTEKLLRINESQEKIKKMIRRKNVEGKLKDYLNSKLTREQYIQRAEEQQNMRSSSSRDGDPIMPDNLESLAKKITRQGMFVSSVNKAYAFYYKIHSSKQGDDHDTSDNTPVTYCWSFYVKILGARTVTVWQYHRFADDIIEQVAQSVQEKGDDPNDLLNMFLKKIGQETSDMILKEAEEEKIDFKLDNTEPEQQEEISVNLNDIDFPNAKSSLKKKPTLEEVTLDKQEQRSWEIYWIQNLRQQLHLEL